MAHASRDRDYALLEREIESNEYRELLTNLHRGEPFLRQFSKWGEVIAFMRGSKPRDPRTDQVLRPILAAYGQDHDHRWQSILLAIFWPALKSIHINKRRWDVYEPDEVRRQLFWAFIETIRHIDLQRHRDGLTPWIWRKTVERLREAYKREWKHTKRKQDKYFQFVGRMGESTDEIDTEALVLRDEHERGCRRLWRYVQAGVITEADFYLIVRTRLYGEPASEYARREGRKPDTVRKQRRRAEAAIRRHEKDMQKKCQNHVPLRGSRPPFNQ